jgi:UDP-2,3-diacylglucosamine pyrophosphatase LpxH
MHPELQKYNLLFVSDLHLSEGIRAQSKKYSLKEDFFFDRQFARFLSYYRNSTYWSERKWHLIILGDCLDLLQVTSYQDAPLELRSRCRNPKYGLDCGEEEAMYKLGKVAEGHREFFEALAEFVADDNLLTIIKGNHDVEFHYPRVREEFLRLLKAVYDGTCTTEAVPRMAQKAANINPDSVLFSDWFYYEKKLLWVEHGNQYDETNAFKYYLAPLLPIFPGWPPSRQNEIDLPLGSLFVRYLFNTIEEVEPFADNIKPQSKFIRWLLKKHPATALRFAVSDGAFMLRKLRRAWTTPAAGSYARREQEHNAKLSQLAVEWAIDEPDLRAVSDLRARSVLKETSSLRWKIIRGILRWRLLRPLLVVSAVLILISGVVAIAPVLAAVLPNAIRYLLWDRWIASSAGTLIQTGVSVIRWLIFPIVVLAAGVGLHWLFSQEQEKQPSGLAPSAQEVARRLGVRYVIMGHTHDADLRSVGSNGEEYFNTGTWTKVFSEEERLIRADVEFVYIQGLRRGEALQLKLMEWDDDAQEPRLLKLFEKEK